MKRFWSATTQKLSQKLGKAKASEEEPTFLAALDRLHETKLHFKTLVKNTKSVFDANKHELVNDADLFLKSDIKSAYSLESTYKTIKLDLDSKRGSVEKYQGIPEKEQQLQSATEACERVRQEYQAIKDQLIDLIDTIDARKGQVHQTTVTTVVNYLQAYPTPGSVNIGENGDAQQQQQDWKQQESMPTQIPDEEGNDLGGQQLENSDSE